MSATLTPLATIEAAFKKLEASVSREDARTFHSTVLKDVRNAALDVEKWQRERGLQRNMRRIDPLIKGIERYAHVIEVLCNGTPYLPWIWV